MIDDDGLVECDVCRDVRRYDIKTGKLLAACACCADCAGSGLKDRAQCSSCTGTGRCLPGSEEVTAVEGVRR
jgi:hypothetical protein